MKRFLFCLVVLLVCWVPARAHDTGLLTLTLRLDSTTLTAEQTYPTAQGAPTTITLSTEAQSLVLYPTRREVLEGGKTQLVISGAPLSASPQQLQVGAALGQDQRLLITVLQRGNVLHQRILDATHPQISLPLGNQESLGATALRFVGEGLHHIASGPDHILFVVGLLLLGGGLRRLLKIVTAFTLAHSITLGIAALRLWNPSSQVIEPLIALSIVCVGVENLIARPGERDLRPLLAFGFGFIHGFGFAGPLVDSGLPQGRMALSLLSFNLGVECGQSVIVLACAPLLALLARQNPRLAKRALIVGSALVSAAGLFWFVQRVLA